MHNKLTNTNICPEHFIKSKWSDGWQDRQPRYTAWSVIWNQKLKTLFYQVAPLSTIPNQYELSENRTATWWLVKCVLTPYLKTGLYTLDILLSSGKWSQTCQSFYLVITAVFNVYLLAAEPGKNSVIETARVAAKFNSSSTTTNICNARQTSLNTQMMINCCKNLLCEFAQYNKMNNLISCYSTSQVSARDSDRSCPPPPLLTNC